MSPSPPDSGDELVTYRRAPGFVMLDNEAVNDAELSLRARGLLVWCLGRPRGWRFSTSRVPSPTERRDAVRTAMRELVARGYARRRHVRDSSGRLTTITEVAELPRLLPPIGLPGTDEPSPARPAPVLPAPARPSRKTGREGDRTEVGRTGGQSSPEAPRRRRPLRADEVVLRGEGRPPSAEYLAAREALGRPSRAAEVDVVIVEP